MKERGKGKKETGYNGAMLREKYTRSRQKIMLNVQGSWTGHVSSRENSRGLSDLEAGTCYGAQGSGGHGKPR